MDLLYRRKPGKKIASHDDFILNFPKKLYSETTELTISQKRNLKRYS